MHLLKKHFYSVAIIFAMACTLAFTAIAHTQYVEESPRIKTVRQLQSLGLTQHQAVAMTANLERESQFDHRAVGDSTKAFGLGQWHPARQQLFKQQFGINIQQSSFEQQLQFIVHELSTTEKKAWQKLSATLSHSQAAKVASKYYFRPKHASEAKHRAKLATEIHKEVIEARKASLSKMFF